MADLISEQQRLTDQNQGRADWLRWGPYLSERQWGTVREDYSANGQAWTYFPHDHARSRTYRWGEDGLAGISDDTQTLCFALALWNHRDPILKERLFGLTNPEGNHGEDVKELYYYLDNTPTHSYQKHLYKYPQAAFPYADLVQTNRNRNRLDPEYELLDTGIFAENRYFDVQTEYAKAGPDDLLIRITIHNRGPETAPLTLLPTLWFRNRWAFGAEAGTPAIRQTDDNTLTATHERLGQWFLHFEPVTMVLFTDNETNRQRLYGQPNRNAGAAATGPDSVFVKDGFHTAIVGGHPDAFSSRKHGTKAAPTYALDIEAGQAVTLRLRLTNQAVAEPLASEFDSIFHRRIAEADAFYAALTPDDAPDLAAVRRQAWAGVLWSKQYFHYDVERWLTGDPGHPAPPRQRWHGRNGSWTNLRAEDIMLMPDKWEYPWFASWDLAFHCLALAPVDPAFAKAQLLLLMGDRYLRSDGAIPAYEWSFSDVNPPVQMAIAWELYEDEKKRTGHGDRVFLETAYHRLNRSYNWWLKQGDSNNNGLFEGGFLGLDNVSVFDRSHGLPAGSHLDQADGTAWMATATLYMLQIALELAQTDPGMAPACVEYFNRYTLIAESLHKIADLWDSDPAQDNGFFYDVLSLPGGRQMPLPIRSLVSILPLTSVCVIDKTELARVPALNDAIHAYLASGRCDAIRYLVLEERADQPAVLLSLLTKAQIERALAILFDEREMLAPGGIRSLSKAYQNGYSIQIDGQNYGLRYCSGESDSSLYGGNSNWRGPVWLPLNYVIVKALSDYCDYFGPEFTVEFPAASGAVMPLRDANRSLRERMRGMFLPDAITGQRPIHGRDTVYANDPHFRDLVLFYEHFDGDTSRGLGASHQTGWSALVAVL
jgi:hypothetical protein